MRIATLINQYPKVSHTFIRREIHALERRGLSVARVALRGWDAETPDADDRAEQARTHYLLRGGVAPLLVALARRALREPARTARALRMALRLSRGADRALPYHLIALAEAAALCDLAARENIDHVHAHFGTNGAEVALLAHALGGPRWSFTVHGPEEFDRPAALKLAEKIRDAAFVVAISSFGRSQLYRLAAPQDWPKIRIVPCGLEAGFAGEAMPVPDVPRLVCVGRLSEQKGQLILLDAAKALAAAGVAFELVLAGDGEMRGLIEQRIAALDLRARVRITGWISSEAVRDEILAARALVLPSFAEGLPVVLMEAMALARPVIATYVAGIPELVRPGTDGWLVPAGDVDALAAAMRACLATPAATLSAMGATARARALTRHDVDRAAALLAEAMGDRR